MSASAWSLMGLVLSMGGAGVLGWGTLFAASADVRRYGLTGAEYRNPIRKIPVALANRFASRHPDAGEHYVVDDLVAHVWGLGLLFLGFIGQAVGAWLSAYPWDQAPAAARPTWGVLTLIFAWLSAINWRSLVDVLSAALTPVIAIVTAYIAYQQYRVNKIRLRHEQYERRATVFRGVLEHLSAIARDGSVRRELLPDYIRTTSEKEFMLDRRLNDYLEEIYKRSVKAWFLDEQNRTIPPGDPRKADVVNQHVAEIQWLLDQISEIRDRFARYLRLE